MDKNLRTGLKKRAEQLGFDSSQALLRYVSKTIVDGREVTFGEDDWGQPSHKAAVRLNRWAEEAIRDSKAGNLKHFTDTDKALAHLNNL